MEAGVVTKIEEIVRKSDPLVKFDSRNYSLFDLFPVKKDLPSPINVMTLTSFKEGIKAVLGAGDMAHFIHVKSPTEVRLRSEAVDEFSQRINPMTADISKHLGSFQYGKKYSQEDFIIELQANFEDTANRANLIEFASYVSSQEESVNEDDGVTQRVSVKTGVHLTETAAVPNPIALKPFKTFPEIDIPEESFVFRVHKDHGSIRMALYSSESKTWELNTMLLIKEFLKETGLTVI